MDYALVSSASVAWTHGILVEVGTNLIQDIAGQHFVETTTTV